ncbi:MAG: hypothetical protein WDZ70_00935 [Candidatus Paceibacterota bacterium]
MNIPNTRRGNAVGMTVALLSVVAILVLLFVVLWGGENIPSEEPIEREFQTFESEEYGFSLEYPEGWDVATSSLDQTLEPRFVFYQPPVVGSGERPYDHFANDTYVGIYPEGIATEGLLGVHNPITADLPALDIAEGSVEYVLEDGTPFAWFLRFEESSELWGESGYVWGRAAISGLETVCMQNGEEVNMNACGLPMEDGAEIVRRGDVDSAEWETVQQIIESIRFGE